MTLTTVLGLTAGLCTTLAFVPQVLKTWRTHHTRDISLGMFVHRWYSYPVERPSMPHLRAWYDRLGTRPAYKTHIMIPVS